MGKTQHIFTVLHILLPSAYSSYSTHIVPQGAVHFISDLLFLDLHGLVAEFNRKYHIHDFLLMLSNAFPHSLAGFSFLRRGIFFSLLMYVQTDVLITKLLTWV